MHWHRSSLTQHGKFALTSMNSPDKAPDFLIRIRVIIAVVNIVGVSAPITTANTDTDTSHIIGHALTFRGILGFGAISCQRYKHLFYYAAIAAAVTGTNAAIFVSAFFDRLY